MAEQAQRRPLDDVDRRMIELLQEDGRLSVNELARRGNVSRATAYSRFERLRADGVITGFRAIVDPAAVGTPIAALLFIKVEQHSWPEGRRRILDLPGVRYLALTSGTTDIVCLVRVADVETLRDVVLVQLHRIPAVRSSETIFILDEDREIPGGLP